MKLDVTVDLDWLSEDYTIEDAFRDEITSQMGEQAAKALARADISTFNKDEEVKSLKLAYEKEISSIRKTEEGKRQEILAMITSVFDEFLSGVACKTNRWGEKEKETTVGEMLRDMVAEKLDSSEKGLISIIEKQVTSQMKMTEYDIKELIKNESRKSREENAKKVAEFIVKGSL